ncbi:MAG: SDR family NAD(P)-dependent oxidoreductase [Phycisphaerales bacterium]
MYRLAGKRVWLTGASTGIGRALALELAARGAVCGLTARSEDALRTLHAEVEGRGGRAIVVPGDVTDLARMKAVAAELNDRLGGIDILIANAGTHLFTRPERFDSEEYLGLMNLNYGGMVRCIEAVLPFMLPRREGRIVGVSSLAGFRGVPRAAAYGASKAAMINFLESLRFHLSRERIGVTIVNPGFVRTPLTDKNDFHMPFLIDADRAARIMCAGIARGRDEISFPVPFNWMIKAMRVIPYPLYKRIMARACAY